MTSSPAATLPQMFVLTVLPEGRIESAWDVTVSVHTTADSAREALAAFVGRNWEEQIEGGMLHKGLPTVEQDPAAAIEEFFNNTDMDYTIRTVTVS